MIRRFTIIALVAACQFHGLPCFAGTAKNGQGSMTVTPTIVNSATTTNYFFRFRTSKSAFNPGSQVTLVVPALWSPPQTNDPSAAGFIRVTPIQNNSTAVLSSISGSGPWLLTIDFATSQNQAGFSIDYQKAVAPAIAGLYRFSTQSKQAGSAFRTLKRGSPSVTVNNIGKINSSVSLASSLNPSVYGQSVTFTAKVTGAAAGALAGTLSFKDGDSVLSTVPLNAQNEASFSTNRFSVADSPDWITAEYSGNTNFNPSVSPIFEQEVTGLEITLSGLAAANKTYDGTAQATLDTSNVSFQGILPGDDVSLDLTAIDATFANPNVASAKPVTIPSLVLGGNEGDNYLVNTLPAITANIYQASLVVKANDVSRPFGTPNPPFTATYSGFVTGEDPSVLNGAPAFSTTANTTSSFEGSPYVIDVTAGTLSAPNYNFAFVPGYLMITPATPQPHRITSIVCSPDGATVTLICAGTPGQNYVIQSAAGPLATNWTSIATNRAEVNGTMKCVDFRSPSETRFYRTALP